MRPILLLVLLSLLLSFPGALLQPRTGLAGELRLAPGEALRAEDVRRLLEPALPVQPAGRRLVLRIASPRLPLVNAASDAVSLRLRGLQRNYRRFVATLEVAVENGPVNPLPVTGEMRTELEVPVPLYRLARGRVVGEQDLTPGWIDQDALGESTVRSMGEVLGKETLRPLLAGRPLRQEDLGPARLVRRGEPVSVRFGQPGLELIARGIAESDAALGEPIRVVNVDSGREVTARVAGPGLVEVATARLPASPSDAAEPKP